MPQFLYHLSNPPLLVGVEARGGILQDAQSGVDIPLYFCFQIWYLSTEEWKRRLLENTVTNRGGGTLLVNKSKGIFY